MEGNGLSGGSVASGGSGLNTNRTTQVEGSGPDGLAAADVGVVAVVVIAVSIVITVVADNIIRVRGEPGGHIHRRGLGVDRRARVAERSSRGRDLGAKRLLRSWDGQSGRGHHREQRPTGRRTSRNSHQSWTTIVWTGRDNYDVRLAGASFICSACRLVLLSPDAIGPRQGLKGYVLRTVKTSASGVDGTDSGGSARGGWPGVEVVLAVLAATVVVEEAKHKEEGKEGATNRTTDDSSLAAAAGG